MTDLKILLSRVRIVTYHSSRLVKTVVAAGLALAVAAVVCLNLLIGQTRAATENLRSQAARLEQENNRLEQYILELGTVQSVQRIAQEELGLVDPDTVVFTPVQ